MPKTDWMAISDALWTRSFGGCEKCGHGLMSSDEGARHHRLLRSAGGRHELSNLVLLCHPCHRWVHGNPLAATKAGWIVSRYGRTPLETPLEHAWHGPVLLADSGQARKHVVIKPRLARDLPEYVSNMEEQQ